MARIVLRVRLVTGDRLDVTYEESEARHGDREVVVFGRGVAAIEIEPRGAVL